MWECEWRKKIQTEPRINKCIERLDIVTLLNPREAFFGGRTNAIKLHHKVQDDEQINYNNMISLYPCANLECHYPVGHPEFIDQPKTTDIMRYYGLVKCNILPPYELYLLLKFLKSLNERSEQTLLGLSFEKCQL